MRSIDLQDNLSKAPLAGREQNIQQASSELGSRHGARELDQQHILDHTRTRPSDDADAAQNRVDRHGGQPRRQARRRRRRAQGDDEQTRPAAPPGRCDTSRQIDLMA